MYLKEGEDHATAQDEFVDLAQHGLNDRDLRRDLTVCGVGVGAGVVVGVRLVQHGLNDRDFR